MQVNSNNIYKITCFHLDYSSIHTDNTSNEQREIFKICLNHIWEVLTEQYIALKSLLAEITVYSVTCTLHTLWNCIMCSLQAASAYYTL